MVVLSLGADPFSDSLRHGSLISLILFSDKPTIELFSDKYVVAFSLLEAYLKLLHITRDGTFSISLRIPQD